VPLIEEASMLLCWVALGALGVQDDELRKEIERLRAENAALREKADLLEQQALEEARSNLSLRQTLKLLQSGVVAADRKADVPPPVAAAAQAFPAPVQAIKGKIVHVNAELGFVTLGIGKREGVQIGYRFEIFRESFENGADTPAQTRLAVAEVEKYIGQDSMSKLKLLEGDVKEIKLDDIAVAIRKLAPVAPEAGPVAADGKTGIFRITGRAGAGYLTDYGQLQGARQTDLVFCYKDGVQKAKLRIDRVDKSYSVANVVQGSLLPGMPPPDVGDEIYTRELDKVLSGKVSFSNAQKNLVAIDLRARDGVKVGQRFEVHRLGKKIGVIQVTDVAQWGSWAKPEGDTKYEDLQRYDIVRVIPE
jgi:hypothetical protein